MKFIKLTLKSGNPIVLNVSHIGHFYANKDGITNVGVTTHNNGGFSVTETVDEIRKLINKM
jgi:hypothetical protein